MKVRGCLPVPLGNAYNENDNQEEDGATGGRCNSEGENIDITAAGPGRRSRPYRHKILPMGARKERGCEMCDRHENIQTISPPNSPPCSVFDPCPSIKEKRTVDSASHVTKVEEDPTTPSKISSHASAVKFQR
jgi:hypothetical protein